MSTQGTKASDLFVQALEAEGVKHIFAVPGEENLDMVESLEEHGEAAGLEVWRRLHSNQ